IINLHQMGPDWSRTVGNILSQAKEASVIIPEHSHGCEYHALSMCCKLAPKQLDNGHSLSKYMGKPKSHIKEASEQRDTHLQGPNQPMEAHIPSPSTHYFETRIDLPLPADRSAEIATSRAVDQIGQAISDRSANRPVPSHSLLGISSHALRFPTQRDESGHVF